MFVEDVSHRVAAVESQVKQFTERVEQQLATIKLDYCKILDVIAHVGKHKAHIDASHANSNGKKHESHEVGIEKLQKDVDNLRRDLDANVNLLRELNKSIAGSMRLLMGENAELRKKVKGMDEQMRKSGDITAQSDQMSTQVNPNGEAVRKLRRDFDDNVQQQKLSTMSIIKFALTMMQKSKSSQEMALRKVSEKEARIMDRAVCEQYSLERDPMFQEANVLQTRTQAPRCFWKRVH